MGDAYLLSPLEFLLSTLFSLYILAVMLRFLLQWVRADFYNPISQFLVRITSPLLRPLRRLIPGLGGLDIAALVLMLALQMLALALVMLLRGGALQPLPLLLWSVAELVDLAFNVFIFGILIQALLSWISPQGYNPVVGILHSLTTPVLRPLRRRVPPLGGVDLTPLAAIIGLQVAKMLLLPPLRHLAMG